MIHKFALSVLALMLLLTPLAWAQPSLSMPALSSPPLPDARQRLERLAESDPVAASGMEGQDVQLSSFMYWSAMVYQAVADNNWEIYFKDASRETRLTFHGAMDIHPRLNRGTTKIVFASNRTGYYQIFTMNVDGSGLAQLTFTNAHNDNPAWSPDGTHIAFESYRDGQSEIYVMDASGAHQTRVTWDAGPDINPTWSLDGLQIAFSSGRTGGYRIWVMQADGSQLRQLTTQPYSLYPAWSPDGQQLAYSCDSNNDGWLEAWKINADGTSATQVYSAQYYYPYTKDIWVRSWSPDGKYVAFTEVEMIYYEGEWYWTQGHLFAAQHNTDVLPLSSTKVGWNPDLQTTDTEAPIATFEPLPPYRRAGKLRVRGAVVGDVGGSGIAQLEFQHRTDDGPWETDVCTAECLDFLGTYFHDVMGVAGTTMYFRMRAIDEAHNQSRWFETDAGTSVTFFNREFDGQVLDTRGVPRYNAHLSSSPPMLGDTESNPQGRFSRYTVITGTHTVMITQTGYGALPPTPLAFMTDTVRSQLLPPRQDLIHNGHFETALFPAWDASGSVSPTLMLAAAHSGQGGVTLGRPSPRAYLTNISDQPGYDDEATLAFDTGDHLHIAWTNTDTSSRVVAVSCTSELICSAPWSFSLGRAPVLAPAPDGKMFLLWWCPEENGVMFAVRDFNGNWSNPAKVADTAPDSHGYPDLAVDSLGQPHIVYNYGGAVFYKYKPLGQAWSAAEAVTPSGQYGNRSTIVVGPDGVVHVIYQDTPNCALQYRQRSASGSWGSPQTIARYYDYLTKNSDMVLDRNGRLQVVYSPFGRDGAIYWITKDPSGVWSSARAIASLAGDPRIGAFADGRLAATWNQNGEWVMAYTDAVEQWSLPHSLILKGAYEQGALALHPESNVVALADSVQVADGPEIFAAVAQTWIEPASVSQIVQAITLPLEIHAPTLSFVYQYQSEATTSADTFSLRVQDGAYETTLLAVNANTFTPTLADGWAHAWFPMDAWSGKTISVTFTLSDTADSAWSWVYLDEVTLGAWESPLITAVLPAQIEARSTTLITITGANFIQTPTVYFGTTPATSVQWMDAQTLHVIPPASLVIGLHPVVVSNPGGASATLLDGLQVGHRVLLPFISRAYRPYW